MTVVREPRFPLAALEAVLLPRSTRELARRCGVHERLIHRWRAEGGVPLRSADAMAIRAGLHPALVWDTW